MLENNFLNQEPQENPNNGGIIRRGYEHARNWWKQEDRPGLFEFHYYHIPVIIGSTLLWGGAAIGVVDKVTDTHIADDLANTQITPGSGWLTQLGEAYLQCEGLDAGGTGPYKCEVYDYLLGRK